MNAEFITAIASVIAIVVGLFSLHKQLQSQFFAEYTRRYSELMEKMPVEYFDPQKSKAIALNDEMLKICRFYYDLSSEEYELNRQKRLNPRVWRFWESGIKETVNLPVFEKAWSQKLNCQYNDDFRKYINNLITNSNEVSQ